MGKEHKWALIFPVTETRENRCTNFFFDLVVRCQQDKNSKEAWQVIEGKGLFYINDM